MAKLIPDMKVGRLTLIAVVGHRYRKSGPSAQWQCRCDCGNVVVVEHTNLRQASTLSCGCFRNQKAAARLTTHGFSGARVPKKRRILLQAWYGMHNRCYRKKDISYKWYGGLGIRVLWKNAEEFIRDMEPTWRPGLSLERIYVKGHYCKGNCRWATRAEQARNTTRSRVYTINGTTGCVKDLCAKFGIRERTVYWRLDKYGWNPSDAFLLPPQKRGVTSSRGLNGVR